MTTARANYAQRLHHTLVPLLLAATALLAAAGCGPGTSSGTNPTATPAEDTQVAGVQAASDFFVGENRFPFGVAENSGSLIEDGQVHVRFYLLHQDGREEMKGEADATFRKAQGATPHKHPDGHVHAHEEAIGVYIVDRATFDTAGIWRARFTITTPDAPASREGSVAFQVTQQAATLRVGDAVPPSRNPTARDAKDLAEITTHEPPVPGMYQLTVAEALQQGKPFIVVFSTPAFCVSSMCGPVTDVAAQVYERYKDRATFIHIEPWRLDVARNQGRLVPTDVMTEWRLLSEPWTFVVDPEGRVAARFEGVVTVEELAAALDGALR